MKKPTTLSTHIGRRRFLQIIAATGTAAALWQLGIHDKKPAVRPVRQSRALMGTQINLIVYGPDPDASLDAIQSTFARMEKVARLLSRHDGQSELSTLNRNGFLDHPSKELQEVLLLGQSLSRSTKGAFDVTMLPLQQLYAGQNKMNNPVPPENRLHEALAVVDYRMLDIRGDRVRLEKKGMAVTLDGIGKGYIVDQGVDEFRSRGFDNVYVEAGGDLMVSGTKTAGRAWKIGIRNPRPERSDEFITVDLNDRAIATSGDYMQPFTADLRYHHIIDPRTGISPPELASATVTAPSVALADGLATAAMVMGPEESLHTFASLPDCECLLIGKDLRQYRSQGFHV